MRASLSSRKLVWVCLSHLVPQAPAPVALYPFCVHLRRYTGVICQFHRPNSGQSEPIEPLAVAAEHFKGRHEIFNMPGWTLVEVPKPTLTFRAEKGLV